MTPAAHGSRLAGSAPSWIEQRRSPKALNNLLRLSRHFFAPMADSTSKFGFVAFAETWNGRLAMLGFVIGLGTELLTGQGILGQIGLG